MKPEQLKCEPPRSVNNFIAPFDREENISSQHDFLLDIFRSKLQAKHETKGERQVMELALTTSPCCEFLSRSCPENNLI